MQKTCRRKKNNNKKPLCLAQDVITGDTHADSRHLLGLACVELVKFIAQK